MSRSDGQFIDVQKWAALAKLGCGIGVSIALIFASSVYSSAVAFTQVQVQPVDGPTIYQKRTSDWSVLFRPEAGHSGVYTEFITYLGKNNIYHVEMKSGAKGTYTESLTPRATTKWFNVRLTGVKTQTINFKWDTLGKKAQLVPHSQTITIAFTSHR